MQLLAEMSKDMLGQIYELTYKYGWIKNDEAMFGWLTDPAYTEKYKIEGELSKIIDEGLDELIYTYEQWISNHSRNGWKDNLIEGVDLSNLFATLDYWTIDYKPRVFELVVDSMGGSAGMLDEEDPDYLAESYGLEFLHQYKTTLSENEQIDIDNKLQEATDDREEAKSIVEDRGLINELKQWLINDFGWDGIEWLKDIYRFEDLLESYGPIISNNLDKLLDDAYDQYIQHFSSAAIPGGKSLEENITDINDALEILVSEKDGSLDERIKTFQYGLTIAHHYGSMADHLLGTSAGKGEDFLDFLSEGPLAKEWDRDLAKLLGHPLDVGPKKEDFYDPDLLKHQMETMLQGNQSLQLAASIAFILLH